MEKKVKNMKSDWDKHFNSEIDHRRAISNLDYKVYVSKSKEGLAKKIKRLEKQEEMLENGNPYIIQDGSRLNKN